MSRIKTNIDYEHGQMMGMLVMLQLFENAEEIGYSLDQNSLDTIKRLACESLAEYLNKPEEDVMLLVEGELRKV